METMNELQRNDEKFRKYAEELRAKRAEAHVE